MSDMLLHDDFEYNIDWLRYCTYVLLTSYLITSIIKPNLYSQSNHSTENTYLYCTDIDECAGDHGCQQLCNNTDGSFNCYCNPGYLLDLNGTNCTGWL